jgi:hypothetical protein
MSQLLAATAFDELHIGQRFFVANCTPGLLAAIRFTPCADQRAGSRRPTGPRALSGLFEHHFRRRENPFAPS